MTQNLQVLGSSTRETIFIYEGRRLSLRLLCGIPCGLNDQDEGPQSTRGMFALSIPGVSLTPLDWLCKVFDRQENTVHFEGSVGSIGLRWVSAWHWNEKEAILSRRDTLINDSEEPLSIHRAAMRFGLAPDRYDLWVQTSSWAHENQLQKVGFNGGRLSLASQGGRTLQGGAPYLFVTQIESGLSLVFHLLPRGDWEISCDQSRHAGDVSRPFTTLELGPKTEGFDLLLQPGEAFLLPECWIEAAEGNQPEQAAPALQRHALQTLFSGRRPGFKKTAPVVYNTWFDTFDTLETSRLRQQLAAARTAGCEVFVVDAGWYGNGAGGWHEQVGDWQEKTDAAFKGKMADFADEVRAAGLGFGLWMEPERLSPFAPAVAANPDWFLPGDGGFFYPDLTQPEVYAYIFSEMCRLIDTYHLAWMKVDFNFEMGSSADTFAEYTDHWHALIDGLHRRYPDLFLEGCASGGMRSDLATLASFDAHFLSDTVNPFDAIRLTQGAALRLPTGRLTKWAVLRALPGGLGTSHGDERSRLFAPACADWENCFEVDLDFCWLATLPGIPGLSGDLASLTAEQLARLAQFNGFYKQHRSFLLRSICTLLTPVQPQGDLSGWTAFELSAEGSGDMILLAYRMTDGRERRRFKLPGAKENREYAISTVDDSERVLAVVSGHDLKHKGWLVELPYQNRARGFLLRMQ